MLNKVMLIGNLGRDPEMRYTPNGTAVTQFSVAVNRNSRDEAGEWKKETEWFRIVLFRETAERAAEWLRKGTKVYVEGRLQTRQYEKDGQKHYMTEVVAERFVNLDPRQRDDTGADGEAGSFPGGVPGGAPSRPAGSRPAGPSTGPSEPTDRLDDTDLDDLPF
jgi:single-strand DNA-binding protein